MEKPHAHNPVLYSYEEATREIAVLIATTPPEVSSEGRPVLLTHGHQTDRAFVLMHGLSNCPEQFAALGRLLFEGGHNAFIPRLPFHGEKNRMTASWRNFSAAQMLATCHQSIDLAGGLGMQVVFVGLSATGTVAAWMAQNRADLSRCVLLSPLLAPAGLPDWAATWLGQLLACLPSVFFWWNPALKERNPGPQHAYPRFPTRIIGETMLLGHEVLEQSRREGPRCGAVLVVTSESDAAVSNRLTEKLVAGWRKLTPRGVKAHHFAAAEKVPHDFIDPLQPNQRVDFVYPVLLKLLQDAG